MNNFTFVTMLALIFMGTLMITSVWDNHRRQKLRQRTVDLRQQRALNTVNMLIKQGIRPVPADEHILEIGDGYIVSQDRTGKQHVTYLNNERLY